MPPPDSVAEMQGLYGPYTVAERVLQKIWLRRDFAAGRAVLADGRRLEILFPGTWNLLGGPDFHGARLRFDGELVEGDVEVHFHAGDWRAHGHDANPAFGRVVLHVLLFPPGAGEAPARRPDGRALPALVLLPLLHRDLEDHAADDALETITARDDWRRFAELAGREPAAVRVELEQRAARRWEQKVHFARARLERLGWPEALHHTALEVLGYRRNRANFLEVAEHHPLAAWRTGLEPLDVYDRWRDRWLLHGIRPANHPRKRLLQYRDWVRAVPDWPERWRVEAGGWAPAAPAATGTGDCRKAGNLADRRERVGRDVAGGALGGTRLDTWICDAALPLAAAGLGREDLYADWFHWFPGDLPDRVRRALARLEVAGVPGRPFCHGYAQGLLHWLIERPADATP